MKNLHRDVAIVGMGLHPWGVYPNKSIAEMGVYAMSKALENANNMNWRQIQAMVAGSYGFIADREGVPGQLSATTTAAMMGKTGIPCTNIYNACATGESIMRDAYLAVASGEFDLVMAVGSDKSAGGFFRPQSRDAAFDSDFQRYTMTGETNPAYWAMEMRRRIHDVHTTEEDMALVKVATSKGSVHNPNARYHKAFTLQEVLASPVVCDPLRLFEICATSDGAAAIILAPADQAYRYTKKPILIEGVSLASGTFGDPTIVLTTMSAYYKPGGVKTLSESRNALAAAYKMSGRKPSDINIIELPDNSSWHYLAYLDMILDIDYGESEKLLRKGTFNVDGPLPVCPSGGFGAFGEAVVAQGLWQVVEVATQLRGDAGERQITNNPKVGLAQSYGYAGNNAVVIMSRPW